MIHVDQVENQNCPVKSCCVFNRTRGKNISLPSLLSVPLFDSPLCRCLSWKQEAPVHPSHPDPGAEQYASLPKNGSQPSEAGPFRFSAAPLPAPAIQKEQKLGALPAVHTRGRPWRFVSGSACPWGISGEPVVRRAVPGSRVLAAAPPELPAVACTGCFLRTAEASSSPSDPSGLKAAKQVATHDVHSRNHSRLPKKTPKKNSDGLAQRSRSSSASFQVLNPTVTSGTTAGFPLPFRTRRRFTKNKPNEKMFYADISPVAGGQERKGQRSLRKMNYQPKWLFPIVGSSLMSRYSTTR